MLKTFYMNYKITPRKEGDRTVLDVQEITKNGARDRYTGISIVGFAEILEDELTIMSQDEEIEDLEGWEEE